MEFPKKRDRRDSDSRMASSGSPAVTTTTMCDTTTANIPPTLDATIQNAKEVPQDDLDHRKHQATNDNSLHYVNEGHKTSAVSFNSIHQNTYTTHKNTRNVIIPSSHYNSLATVSQSFSRTNSNSHESETEYKQPSAIRKMKSDQTITIRKECKRSKKSTLHHSSELDRRYASDVGEFHTNVHDMPSNKKHRHLSRDTNRDDYINGSKFENVDVQPGMDEQDLALYNSDVMSGLGSKSNVPEEVRLRINSRERQRMHDLNTALDSLRQVMPYSSGPTVKKLSKMSTLLLARNYIVMLTRSLEEMKRLVQELSTNAKAKTVPTPPPPLVPDPVYIASMLSAANHGTLSAMPTPPSLYFPPPPLAATTAAALHRMPPSIHCLSSSSTGTGTPYCACVDCHRKKLLAASAVFLETKKSS